MKSFKIKLLICILFCFSISVKSQSLETIKVYYDYARTQIKEVYTVKKGSGIKEGVYKFYDENRMLILEVQYSNNMKNGIAKSYYDYGKSSITSKPSLFYGKLEYSMTYKDDELDGSYKSYTYETGKQTLKFDTFWSNGELIKSTEYYNNGNKKEIKQKNGICNMWYETGEKMLEYTNVNFMNIGSHTEWFKNGKINIQGTWNNESKEEGIWKQWDENGILTETLYDNGVDVEKDKALKEKQMKDEYEKSEKIRKKQETEKLEREIEAEKKRIKEERERKMNQIDEKIKITNEKSKEIEKKYNVIDDIQTALFGKETYKTKKKNLYNAYIILKNDLLEKMKSDEDLDKKILLLETLEKLLDKVTNLSDSNTKDLEKELKNVTDVNKIKEIFKL